MRCPPDPSCLETGGCARASRSHNQGLRLAGVGDNLKRYKLVRNKRAEADPEFAKLILQIGDGYYDQKTDEPCAAVSLPDKFLAQPHDDVKQLLEWTYGNLIVNTRNVTESNLHCFRQLLHCCADERGGKRNQRECVGNIGGLRRVRRVRGVSQLRCHSRRRRQQ